MESRVWDLGLGFLNIGVPSARCPVGSPRDVSWVLKIGVSSGGLRTYGDEEFKGSLSGMRKHR